MAAAQLALFGLLKAHNVTSPLKCIASGDRAGEQLQLCQAAGV